MSRQSSDFLTSRQEQGAGIGRRPVEGTGAWAMVRCLTQEGVSTVFGYPGAAIAPFYDALAESPSIGHVLTRTEQGAGHAASGYARVSGRVGVCVATSGPGATNLLTALATAYSDSIPMVAITGQAATGQLGRDVFQEVDATGAAQPFTKYSYLVKSADDIGRVFKEAFHIASTGRKGPVLIDVPVDVQSSPIGRFGSPQSADIRGYKPRYAGHALQVKRVAEAIKSAERPLFCLGGGIFLSEPDCPSAATAFCERASIPSVTTLMGVGIWEPGRSLNYGMIGAFGRSAANAALARSDLLVVIGARVGDRTIGALGSATVAHVDVDPAEIGKNIGTAIPLVGDAYCVIRQLEEQMGDWNMRDSESGKAWLRRLDGLREDERERARESEPKKAAARKEECERRRADGYADPSRFLRELSKMLDDDAVYIADVGQNQIWSAMSFESRARFLTTGGMGTMGYSIPAAIGAQIARPGRQTLAVFGDGALQMSLSELGTISGLGLPVKMALIDNGSLGMVRELQEQNFGRAFATDVGRGAPDMGLLAGAYGIPYERHCDTDRAIEAAARMLRSPGPFLLQCVVSPTEDTL